MRPTSLEAVAKETEFIVSVDLIGQKHRVPVFLQNSKRISRVLVGGAGTKFRLPCSVELEEGEESFEKFLHSRKRKRKKIVRKKHVPRSRSSVVKPPLKDAVKTRFLKAILGPYSIFERSWSVFYIWVLTGQRLSGNFLSPNVKRLIISYYSWQAHVQFDFSCPWSLFKIW